MLRALLICLASFLALSSAQDVDRVEFAKIKSLLFRYGYSTIPRRLDVQPQIQCIRGDACDLAVPKTIECTNRDNSMVWKCEGTGFDQGRYHFGQTNVRCEGWRNREDPYVSRKSCFVQYEMYQNRPTSSAPMRPPPPSRRTSTVSPRPTTPSRSTSGPTPNRPTSTAQPRTNPPSGFSDGLAVLAFFGVFFGLFFAFVFCARACSRFEGERTVILSAPAPSFPNPNHQPVYQYPTATVYSAPPAYVESHRGGGPGFGTGFAAGAAVGGIGGYAMGHEYSHPNRNCGDFDMESNKYSAPVENNDEFEGSSNFGGGIGFGDGRIV